MAATMTQNQAGGSRDSWGTRIRSHQHRERKCRPRSFPARVVVTFPGCVLCCKQEESVGAVDQRWSCPVDPEGRFQMRRSLSLRFQMYLVSHPRTEHRLLRLLGGRRIETAGQKAAIAAAQHAYQQVPFY